MEENHERRPDETHAAWAWRVCLGRPTFVVALLAKMEAEKPDCETFTYCADMGPDILIVRPPIAVG